MEFFEDVFKQKVVFNRGIGIIRKSKLVFLELKVGLHDLLDVFNALFAAEYFEFLNFGVDDFLFLEI